MKSFDEKMKKALDKGQKIEKPSYLGIFALLLVSGGLIYLFNKYGLKDILEILTNFAKNHTAGTYIIAFFAALVEGTIILSFMPGSLTILAMGALAASGSLSISVIYAIVVVGAVMGDNLGYFLGGIYGRKIIKTGMIDPVFYKLSEDFVEKHGKKSIALSRFVGGMKELAPFIAGSVKMNKKDFIIFNFVGALGWALVWLGLGYVFYQTLDVAQEYLKYVLMGISLIFVIIVGRFLYKNQHLFDEVDKK